MAMMRCGVPTHSEGGSMKRRNRSRIVEHLIEREHDRRDHRGLVLIHGGRRHGGRSSGGTPPPLHLIVGGYDRHVPQTRPVLPPAA